jgi:hypothetical protein
MIMLDNADVRKARFAQRKGFLVCFKESNL